MDAPSVDVRKGSRFVIRVADRKHTAEFQDVGPSGEFVFRILDRDHRYLQAHAGGKGHLFVTFERKRYIFEGKVSSLSPGTATVFAPLLLGEDRRGAERFRTTSLPARLIESGFLRPKVTSIYVLGISKTGVKLSTPFPLDMTKVYDLEWALAVHHSHRSCTAVISARYCLPAKVGNICGCRFEAISPDARTTIRKFLDGLTTE